MLNTVRLAREQRNLSAVISDEILERLGRDTASARGLPNAAFVDPAFHELEKDLLFPHTWTFAAAASFVPNRGDVLPLKVAGRPVILVRGNDNAIRAFHNVCPHRGARLVTETQRKKVVLTCPYHGWSFGLDGGLRGRPHYHGPGSHQPAGDEGHDEACLFPIRSVTWHDWVFVNLDGQAEPFETYIAPVEREFVGSDLSVFRRSEPDMHFEFASNWKLVAENFCDFYHVFMVHPALDIAMADTTRRAMRPNGRHMFNGYEFAGSATGIAPDDATLGLPVQPGRSRENAQSMVFGLIFPNAVINVYPESLQFVHFEPIATDRTIMHMWFYYVDGAASAPEHANARARIFESWAQLNAEDEGICRQLQEGRACEAYDGGRMAPYWDAGTIHFHRQVALAMRHDDVPRDPGSS
ncbi:MAG: aromatic ring-hydroxylating dioxygenase subunit alpha [Alphaproteobacteria bacterium]|nr:aromatic ring-hydroxylating dioxygenase subunit alpha [Alphaproteobacteria bacterium]